MAQDGRFVRHADGSGALEIMWHIDRKALRGQKAGGLRHALGAAAGTVQPNDGGKALAIYCGDETVHADGLSAAFETKLRVMDWFMESNSAIEALYVQM